MKMSCDNIEATKATQVRTKLSKEVIDQYREDLEAGAIFPEIICFAENGSERIILSDGFHRLFAYIHAGREEIEVDLREGGLHDALLFALGANTAHGLRRSNADKVRAVQLALRDPEISQMTQQEIADICRVERHTVGRISRRDLIDENDNKGNNGTKFHEPEENKPENVRPTKPEPTQNEIERDELRQAMSLIRAFPYSGDDTEKLGLSRDDIADVNYCIDWLTEVAKEYVRCQYRETDDRNRC